MGRKPSITPGMQFGHLTVLSDSGERKKKYVLWNCVCSCGREVRFSSRDLLQKKVQDCGCNSKVPRSICDLTGQRFGRLTVLYPTDRRADSGSVVWHTICDCGREKDVPARRLLRGQVRSCGCLSHPPLKDIVGKRFGRLTVTGYAGTGQDLGKNNPEHFWQVRCDCGNEKIVGQWELEHGDTRSCGCLHNEKLVESMKLIDGTSITALENEDKLRSSNTSGKTGVSYYTRDQKWAAYMTFKGTRYRLGEYRNKEDAIQARMQAEQKREEFIDWYYEEIAPDAERKETETPEAHETARIEPRRRKQPAAAKKKVPASAENMAVTA